MTTMCLVLQCTALDRQLSRKESPHSKSTYHFNTMKKPINCASAVCTFGAALWQLRMHTSPCNVHPQLKRNICHPVILKLHP